MQTTTGARSGLGGSAALLVLLVGQAMANIDLAIVNLAVPAISTDLDVGSSELTLIVTAYALCSAVLLAPAARLGERQGVRRVYLWGLTLFTFASVVCGLATSAAVLIAGRCLQGAATALMISQVLVGIHRWFTGPARGRALGWNVLTLSGGAGLALIAGLCSFAALRAIATAPAGPRTPTPRPTQPSRPPRCSPPRRTPDTRRPPPTDPPAPPAPPAGGARTTKDDQR
ncbi:MFS transporter [Streptomyces cavourensis]|uniref:MFS transporter n=1 Tax=Streptomyces cavourensis TaxID=67258 RepID=UPI00116A51AF|nr:MFS transporter [Streptomyces cavourensis]TQO32074.1 MFS transporter [Streptomyces cavourensis]